MGWGFWPDSEIPRHMQEPCMLLWIILVAIQVQRIHSGLGDPKFWWHKINRSTLAVPKQAEDQTCLPERSGLSTWGMDKKIVETGRRVKKVQK